jgi:hypothetical protein
MAGKKSVFAFAAIIAGAVSIVAVLQTLPSRREPRAKAPAISETVAPPRQRPPRTPAPRYISDRGYPWLDNPNRELMALLDERARRTKDALERIHQPDVAKRFIELHKSNMRALRVKRGSVSFDLVMEIRTLLSPFVDPNGPTGTPEDDIQRELSMRRLARGSEEGK